MDIESYLLGKNSSGGSGGSQPNIFVQTTQPETKDGIWVQTDKTYDKVVIDEEVYTAGNWDLTNNVAELPKYFRVGTQVGNYLYLWGDNKLGYKYDFVNNTYTSINGNLIEAGNDLICSTDKYISFRSTTNRRYQYLYDIENDQLHMISSLNSNNYMLATSGCSAVMKDKVVYQFGYFRPYSSDEPKLLKIDYTNDLDNPTISVLNCPYPVGGEAVLVGDDVYLFGVKLSSDNYRGVMKYNITNDSYTTLNVTSPVDFWNNSGQMTEAIKIGNYIYFRPSEARQTIYRFDITNETFEDFSNGMPSGITYIGDYMGFGEYNNKLYIMGGTIYDGTSYSSTLNTKTASLISKTYNQDSLVISQGLKYDKYATQLYPNDFTGKLLTTINNVYLYNNNTMYSNLPTYIGNGTTWTKIKG